MKTREDRTLNQISVLQSENLDSLKQTSPNQIQDSDLIHRESILNSRFHQSLKELSDKKQDPKQDPSALVNLSPFEPKKEMEEKKTSPKPENKGFLQTIKEKYFSQSKHLISQNFENLSYKDSKEPLYISSQKLFHPEYPVNVSNHRFISSNEKTPPQPLTSLQDVAVSSKINFNNENQPLRFKEIQDAPSLLKRRFVFPSFHHGKSLSKEKTNIKMVIAPSVIRPKKRGNSQQITPSQDQESNKKLMQQIETLKGELQKQQSEKLQLKTLLD